MDTTDDDWNAPLGQFPVRERPSLGKLSYIRVAFGGLGLLCAVGTLGALGAIGAFSPGLGWLATPEFEQTRYGPVPRIDGARPAEIYTRPAVSVPGLPRIALLVGGMGLSPRATEAAIAGLPGAVTLGFAPYGADLARQTALARESGS